MSYIQTAKRVIYRMIPSVIRDRMAVHKFKRNGYQKEMWGGGIFSENLEKTLKIFCGDKISKSDRSKIEDDVILSYIKYGTTPSEYFLLDFPHKDEDERQTFLTDKTKDIECLKTMSYEKFNETLTDKYNFYERNKKFFHRDAILINKNSDKSKVLDFFRTHGRLFVKPNDGSYGANAFQYVYDDDNSSVQLINTLIDKGAWIAEELIDQSPEMALWNKSSVNTVRIPSIKSGDQYHILAPYMRTGRKGSVVDNGGAGGIFVAVDEKTGRIISDGRDEIGGRYSVHPDSKKEFKGFVIPHWKELVDLATEIHENMPEHKYVAFDFALSKVKWVLIEGNWGQFLSQIASQTGIREEFLKLMQTK